MKNIPAPEFDSVLVKKESGQLFFESVGGYETRNESIIKLIDLADQQYELADFDWVVISTGDCDFCKNHFGLKVFSYSTSSEDYDLVCPDFNFDHWAQVGVEDYSATCAELARNGDTTPETNMLGWRGASTHPYRANLVRLDDKVNIDAEFIVWDRSNPQRLTCTNYLSMPEQAKKYRYLIDIEGGGYSGRLKHLMFSKRVLFIADRPHKEWFFPNLKPWEHFVPCKRDLSDLTEHLTILKSNPALEAKIQRASFEFAQTHLTRDACLARWKAILNPSTSSYTGANSASTWHPTAKARSEAQDPEIEPQPA